MSIVRQGVVHLVLLDIAHADADGAGDCCSWPAKVNALLPAILMTADSSHSLMRQAIQAHVYSVIPKPIAKNVVLYTVVRAAGASLWYPTPQDDG